VAYAFVPIGFGLLSLGILAAGIVAPAGALHGWTTGAVGLMTLAVMTRASRGPSGRPLMATRSIQLIYLRQLVAAVVRIAVAFGLMREPMLQLSTTAWVAAFGGFVVIYAPLLCTTRRA
jgi:uncharacterized protein involved in response to NO